MGLLVDTGEALHHPRSAGQLRPFAVGESIQMAISVPLGPPDEAAVVEEFVVVAEVDPVLGRGLLAEEELALAGRRIDGKRIERGLRAVEPLDEQPFAIARRSVDT